MIIVNFVFQTVLIGTMLWWSWRIWRHLRGGGNGVTIILLWVILAFLSRELVLWVNLVHLPIHQFFEALTGVSRVQVVNALYGSNMVTRALMIITIIMATQALERDKGPSAPPQLQSEEIPANG